MIPDAELSKRELEVLQLALQGNSNKQIALSLNITLRTVEFHLTNIHAKFPVSSRVELLLKLGHATEVAKIEGLRDSTVDGRGNNTENGGGFNPPMN